MRDDKVRGTAAEALGQLGPAAKAAVPALLDACEDRSVLVRHAAIEALRKIDPEAAHRAESPCHRRRLEKIQT